MKSLLLLRSSVYSHLTGAVILLTCLMLCFAVSFSADIEKPVSAVSPIANAQVADEESADPDLTLAALQAEHDEVMSQYSILGRQIHERSSELAGLIRLKKEALDRMVRLQDSIDTLTKKPISGEAD